MKRGLAKRILVELLVGWKLIIYSFARERESFAFCLTAFHYFSVVEKAQC